ncbi:transcription factor IBH1 [Corylus avellana]|uniref:transcription factor IBH1 n=1 Tax=Corylus avellana TaxID=13451 RepID=UPI00286C50CB|nr:transcription factor IBH1 [Corylus avellana]
MATKGVTLNTNARKIRFARRFISILLKMRKTRSPCSSSSIEDVRKRSQRIKIAAYSSMAHAVGPRRAWSRAVLFKLRSRARHQSMMKRRSFGLQKKRVVVVKNNNDIIPSGQLSQADRLRQLVPGGKAMDMCSLLEETADYISCLATQVKVMQTIADHFSK